MRNWKRLGLYLVGRPLGTLARVQIWLEVLLLLRPENLNQPHKSIYIFIDQIE